MITGAETGVSTGGGCTVTMNGGTVNGTVYVTGASYDGKSQVTLTGGTINSRVWLGNRDGFGTDMEMSGGTITGGNAENGGGIFVANGSTCTISGGTVTNNKATNGGGVYVDGGGALTVQSDAQITSNNATSGGGVYVASGGSCTIDGGSITQNTATSGGGVYVVSGNSCTIGGGTISDNTATGDGGGVYFAEGSTGSLITGSDTFISENSAANGGGVYVANGQLVMSSGTISKNTANAQVGKGGGIYAGGNFINRGGIITDNTAALGGGVYGAATVNLTSSSITDNEADSGGGVYVEKGPLYMRDGEVSNNTAQSGGGIYLGDAVTTADIIPDAGKSISITGNEATGSGGGIYSSSGANLTLNAVLQNNTAGMSGGGVHLSASESDKPWTITIQGGELSGNTATSQGSNFYGVNGTFNVTGGTLKKSTGNVKSIYLDTVDGTVTGGYWDDPADMVETGIYTGKAVRIQGGYFSEQPETGVSGFYMDPSPGYMVLQIDEKSGDSNYRESYPWTVYYQTFTVQPQDQTVEENGSATFSAEATGYGEITYTWQAQPKTSDPYTGEWYDIWQTQGVISFPYDEQSLSFSNVSGTWAGQDTSYFLKDEDGNRVDSGFDPAEARFRCVAKGRNGAISYSNPAELTVTSAPASTITSVTVEPSTATVQTDSTQQFNATVSGTGDYDQTVTWTVEGAVSDGTTIDQNGLLTVEPATPPSTITDVTVTPDTATIQTGGEQQFTATVTGTGDFSQAVTWSVEGAVSTSTKISSDGMLTVGTDETADTLTVIATSNGDSTKSGRASVTVETAPEPVMHSIHLSAEPSEGGSVSGGGEVAEGTAVTVTATANEGYTFSGWQENGATVSSDASYTFTATADRSLVALFEKEEPDNPPEPVDPDEPDEPDNPSDPSEPADPSEPTTPAGPATDNSDGWTAIEDELDAATGGDTITVDMNGTTDVPAAVFETVAGKDVDVTFELEGGVSWTVNGQDIPEGVDLSDLDLGVTLNSDGIPVDVINTITSERDTVQMTLAHDGDFGFTMTLTAPLGAENAGYWANLYHFDEDAERLTFETAAEIDADGRVSLSLSHASQYAIVIDDHSHATIDLPFSDVSAGDWFYDPVVWIYNEGLMTGTSATTFEPNTSTTRAMIVAMLARLENVTSADSAGFTDVSGSDWYATAVNWAASEGIVGGFGDGSFQPNAPITREQMASILYRYAEYKGLDVSARTDLSHYSDADSISSWANDVMSWAVAEGLLTGVTNDQLQPQGNATRAQVAAILQRFLAE